jgi:ketosteroid isomerase-like protein
MEYRTTEQVLDNHLAAVTKGIDAIMEDYSDDSVVMAQQASFQGTANIRAGFEALFAGFPPGFFDVFKIVDRVVNGRFAYITWTAHPFVLMGTDTFVVEDGVIVCQTTANQPASS